MKPLIIFVLITMISQTAFGQLTARQIAQKATEATKVKGVEAVMTMTIMDSKGRERVRKIAQVSKLYNNGKTDKRLVRFLSPADVKGTGLLTFDYEDRDDDIWLYLPALRKTRRIVSSEKSKSFMGSEFSYADMTPPSLDNFTFELLGEEAIRNTPCYQIEWTPLDDDIADEAGFSKRISYVGKTDFVMRKSIYYDIDEALHKEMNVYEIREIDPQNHKYRLMHLEMENLQNGRKSILKVDQIRFSPDIKDDFFTTRYLERE